MALFLSRVALNRSQKSNPACGMSRRRPGSFVMTLSQARESHLVLRGDAVRLEGEAMPS